jgi:hypothetical protein
MNNSLTIVSDIERRAALVAESGLFPTIKNAQQAACLMMLCEAEGLHPMQAIRDYHIVSGRPSMKAEVMQSRFLAAGGKIEWLTLSETVAEATFAHSSGGSVTIKWDLDTAKRAGVLNNPTWQKYPRAMLRSRVISEGVRTVFPGCISGTYTPDEIHEIPLPAPVLQIASHPLEGLFTDEQEEPINAFLWEGEHISNGQTWRDLPKDGLYTKRIKENLHRFIEAVTAAATKHATNE